MQLTAPPKILCCRGNVLTESLPSKGIHRFSFNRTWAAKEYEVQMGSGSAIYVQSFMEIGFGIQKLARVGFKDTQSTWGPHKPSFVSFFKKKESRLKARHQSHDS
jgi:hypothetical protein